MILILLIKQLKVEECDATKADSSNQLATQYNLYLRTLKKRDAYCLNPLSEMGLNSDISDILYRRYHLQLHYPSCRF